MDELENVLTLVKKDDPEKLILDRSTLDKLKNGEETVLSFASHPDKILSYFPQTKRQGQAYVLFCLGLVNKNERNDDIIRTPMSNDCAEILWRWIDRTWIATALPINDDNGDTRQEDFVFHIAMWIFEERNNLWLLREGGSDVETKKEVEDVGVKNGRAFMINDDGSIAVRDEPTLFLGRRGGDNKDELLHEAIFFSDVSKVIHLLDEGHANINFRSVPNNSPLVQASMYGNIDIVKILVDRNADINAGNYPPILASCHHSNDHVLNYLLCQGANPNVTDRSGNGPLQYATQGGEINCLRILLEHPNAVTTEEDALAAINLSIKVKRIDCLEMLLGHRELSNFDLDIVDMFKRACQHGFESGLPIVKTILEKRGDIQTIQTEVINNKKEIEEVLINAYAGLSTHDLACCIARTFRIYHHDIDDEISATNPFLHCVKLAKVAKRYWKVVRRTDPFKADKFHQLYTKFQLGAATILEEIYQDETTEKNWGADIQIIATKEDKLSKFLESNSSKEALTTARVIQAHTLFSQPVLYNEMSRLWYGKFWYKVFIEPSSSNVYNFIMNILGFIALFTLQLPLLLSKGYIPQQGLHRIQRFIPVKYSQLLIILEPFSMFLVQCITDLVFAITFTFIDADDLGCSRTTGNIILLFAVSGAFAAEIREMITLGFKTYFLMDPFNRLDFPGLLLSTLSLFLSLICSRNSLDLILRVLLSIASVLLWLRILRVLTLFPQIGPLTLMVYRMIHKMMLWATLLVCFILAFASGLAKLNLSNDTCSDVGGFAPLVFFEGAISGDNTLFDCREERNGRERRGFANFVIYAFFLFSNVMLLNMLIAIMGESFSSVWDSQEANYVFQRAIHCLGMHEMKTLPIQCLYLPYGLYELVLFLIKRRQTACTSSGVQGRYLHAEEYVNSPESESNNSHRYKHDENKVNMLSSKFNEYILDHQDEASEDDRWRIKLAKKITENNEKMNQTEEKLNDRIVQMEENMNHRIVQMEDKINKNLNEVKKMEGKINERMDTKLEMLEHKINGMEDKMDEMTNLMKLIATKIS